ncbi:hypothetical protein [Pseudoduganella armeniaca]|uniref:Uncharacterized protein n=1 Tax=Pseudoduganella armeniaca TaxID=2072590 RepID=A0A2R4CC89_9BURK|nr:hypothetical protein [Pseudoduganella armeniaca]AVR97229.1 hypothetical protein C9I28_17460 [Pseudoduganella armeniaca]
MAAASWLLPWTAYIFLMLPVAYPARIALFDAGNSVRFSLHRHHFETEARQLRDEKVTNKLWRLGIQGADEVYLLYDSKDDRALADRLLNKRRACSTRRRQVETHFQLITISC